METYISSNNVHCCCWSTAGRQRPLFTSRICNTRNTFSANWINKVVFLTAASLWTPPPAGRPWRPFPCLLLYYSSLSLRLKENASLSFSVGGWGELRAGSWLAPNLRGRLSGKRPTEASWCLVILSFFFLTSFSFLDIVSLHSRYLHAGLPECPWRP